MNTIRTNIFLGLLIASSASSHAGNVFVSLDRYDYNTNLANIDLEYEPLGATIGVSLDLNENSFLQIQYGDWSENNAGSAAAAYRSQRSDPTLCV